MFLLWFSEFAAIYVFKALFGLALPGEEPGYYVLRYFLGLLGLGLQYLATLVTMVLFLKRKCCGYKNKLATNERTFATALILWIPKLLMTGIFLFAVLPLTWSLETGLYLLIATLLCLTISWGRTPTEGFNLFSLRKY